MLTLLNISYTAENEDGTKEILHDVNLCIKDRFVAVTGPNGGGKSTLAKVIAGIIKPTSGKVLLDGEDVTALDVTERARAGIGYAFQQPVRFKGVTVYDLLRVAAGKDITVGAACEYLARVGMCARDYVNREVNASLSGGELKRIEIATMLARGARFTVFDEPEAGIDLWSFSNLIAVFRRMYEEINGTILIISHQERILEMADRIVVIAEGRVTGEGPGAEMLPKLMQPGGVCTRLAAV